MINIILPSTINPSYQLKKKHHFPALRFGELVHNVTYIARSIYEANLEEEFRIIIIDSSPDKDYFKDTFAQIKSLNNGVINIEYFYLNNHLSREDYFQGQGWCECKSINHGYFKFPKEDFLKISSRYIYSNFDKILNQIIYSQNTLCTHNVFRKLTFSPIIFFKYSIWEEFLESNEYFKMNDKNKFYMEHSLYAFLKKKRTESFKEMPRLIDICRSGNTNMKYKINFLNSIKNNLYNLILNRHSKNIRKIF